MSNPDYYSPNQQPGTLLSPWLIDCLSIHGQNRLVSQIRCLQGNGTNPGLSFYGHERSGFWMDETVTDDELVCSIFAKEIIRLTESGMLTPKGPVGTWSELEVPTGTVNGTNKVFTTANLIATRDRSGTTPQSVKVYVNGVLQPFSAYTLTAANTITFTTAPSSGASILCEYIIQQ